MRVMPWLALAVLLGLGAWGCVEEETVYVEKPLWEEPPGGAVGFLGYGKAEEKLTVCGNCHVEKQGEWEETAHAHAWEALQESGHAQEFCEACHTVSARGNPVTDENVGWVSTKDPRYHDVQCESCHGPGLGHVTGPETSQPVARIRVGPELTFGCGECHAGAHHPFVEEWSQSAHAEVQSYVASQLPTNAYYQKACTPCHTAQGALEAWGVHTVYEEQDAPYSEHLGITCAVCHDPHDARNEGQLRFPIDVPSVENNLCMKCHHKRGEPDPRTWRGPHSPEGPLLLGEAGWRPPNFEYPVATIVGTHGTDRNPGLCATCHVNSFTVTDPTTGDFVTAATGHLFEPIPCVDNQGVPYAGECDLSQRTFRSCTESGCHGTEDAARAAFLVARQRIDELVEVLDGLLAGVPDSEFDPGDNRYTTGEGAKFNKELAELPGSHVHNPFLVEALLTASIKQIEIDYGLKPAPGVVLENVLAPTWE